MNIQTSWSLICSLLSKRFQGKLYDLSIEHYGGRLEAYQPPTPSSDDLLPTKPRYELGCLQALPEAIICQMLFREGLIDPTESLRHYLPELTGPKDQGEGNEITVRQVLSHATGYHLPAKLGNLERWNDVVTFLNNTRPSYPPGKICSWNGLSRAILNGLIARVTGKELDVLIRELLEARSLPNAIVERERLGWLRIMLTTNEITSLIASPLSAKTASFNLREELKAHQIPVVRRPIKGRSGYPIAYSFGIARYNNDLWGQNGVGPDYTLGSRFDLDGSLVASLALGAGPAARDQIIQLLATAAGLSEGEQSTKGVGYLVDCQIDTLPGAYTADGEERIEVTVEAGTISCAAFRGCQRIASIDLRVSDEGLLIADAHWSALQIEFFCLPTLRTPCLVLGQVCYTRKT